jgi:hypothetical protein
LPGARVLFFKQVCFFKKKPCNFEYKNAVKSLLHESIWWIISSMLMRNNAQHDCTSENDTASQAVVGAELWHKKAPSYA